MTAANIATTSRKEHGPAACAPSGHTARLGCPVAALYLFVAAECNSAGRTGYQPVFLAMVGRDSVEPVLFGSVQKSFPVIPSEAKRVEESQATLSFNN
jgi:hypothetical protein